jgi:hypothetical protein
VENYAVPPIPQPKTIDLGDLNGGVHQIPGVLACLDFDIPDNCWVAVAAFAVNAGNWVGSRNKVPTLSGFSVGVVEAIAQRRVSSVPSVAARTKGDNGEQQRSTDLSVYLHIF